MLITPVQPHNSLNNIVPSRQIGQPTDKRTNAQPPEIGTPLKKKLSLTKKTFIAKNVVRSGTQAMARKKLFLEMKLQETMRKNADSKPQSLIEHKEDLVQRKQMLFDILKEYEQISKDKNILTAEIRNMKKYLSDIRSKLDQSLTVLNKNTTLFAMKRGLTGLTSNRMKPKHLKRTKKSNK